MKTHLFFTLVVCLLTLSGCKESEQSHLDRGSESKRIAVERNVSVSRKFPHLRDDRKIQSENQPLKLLSSEIANLNDQECLDFLHSLLQTAGDQSSVRQMSKFMEHLASISPVDAMAFLEDVPIGKLRDNMIVAAFNGFVNTDPYQAFRQLDQLPTDEHSKALSIIKSRLAMKDIHDLIDIKGQVSTLNHSHTDLFNQLIGVSAGRQNKSYRELLAATVTFNKNSRKIIGNSWFIARANQDAEDAIASVFSDQSAHHLIEENLLSISAAFSMQNPKKATKWLRSLDNIEERGVALQQTVKAWLAFNSEEAGNWILELEEGKDKDFSRLGAVNYLLQRNEIEAAGQWLDTISDTEIKDRGTSLFEIYKR